MPLASLIPPTAKTRTASWRVALKHLNFIQIHCVYIAVLCFVVSGLFYCQPGTPLAYIDVLFMSVTSVTNTGLNVIPMSRLSLYQQLLMFFSTIFGSVITVTWIMVLVRRHYFYRRFKEIMLYNHTERLREDNKRRYRESIHPPSRLVRHGHQLMRWLFCWRPIPYHAGKEEHSTHMQRLYDKLSSLRPERDERTHVYAPRQNLSPPRATASRSQGTRYGLDARLEAREHHEREQEYTDLLRAIVDDDQVLMDDPMQLEARHEQEEIRHIMRQPRHMLTRKQRYRIGGAEYRALDLLARLVPLFYVVHVVTFAFGFRIYVAVSQYAQEVLQDGHVSPWYWSFYVSLASFNNLGLVPLDASMIPFINAPAPLLMSAALIILGNTGYAIALRFLLWLMYRLTPPANAMDRDTLRILLDHPRRCYSMLFNSVQTYWLMVVLFIINAVEVAVFLATNFWLPVLQGIPWGSRVLDAFYQGVTIRNGMQYPPQFMTRADVCFSAGFTAISIMNLNPGTQIIYIVCMYISVYPVGISIRNSNIYQVNHLAALAIHLLLIVCVCIRVCVCV